MSLKLTTFNSFQIIYQNKIYNRFRNIPVKEFHMKSFTPRRIVLLLEAFNWLD